MRVEAANPSQLPRPPPTLPGYCRSMLLPDDGDDAATCYSVVVHHAGRSVSIEVTVLRSGAWTVLCSARAHLATPPESIPSSMTVLSDGKIYMVAHAGYIIEVDLATADLFTIELPEGVSYDYYRNLVIARGDDSVLYLFQVKGDRFNVWLRRMYGHGSRAGEWVLKDTISVKEACRGDSDALCNVCVVGVGDNAESVFLDLNDSGIILHLHIGTRRAEKVYQNDAEEDDIIMVDPLYMVWPPVFPALAPSDD